VNQRNLGRQRDIAARAVRERAVMRGFDLDGWCLARLMQDAGTDPQVNVAERKFNAWLEGNPVCGRGSRKRRAGMQAEMLSQGRRRRRAHSATNASNFAANWRILHKVKVSVV
jgi:hypothetical protein